jgi:hypothetical protein
MRGLLFTLPLLLAAGWMEGHLRGIDNSFRAKRRAFEAMLPTVQVVVTGGSVAVNGVDPAAFGVPAFNLGGGSQSLHYDVALVSHYLDRMPQLRLVLIAQPYTYLHMELRNSPEAWRQHFYSVYWDVPVERPSAQLITIQRYSYIALYTPMTALQYALQGFDVRLTERLRPNGWWPNPPPAPAVRAAGVDPSWMKVRAEGRREQMRAESLIQNQTELEALAARLSQRGVRLVMAWVPVAPGYTEMFGQATLTDARAAVAALEQRAGVRFFDYSRDPRFGRQDFFNADHLDENGARKWSAILADEVVTPLLATPAAQGGEK